MECLTKEERIRLNVGMKRRLPVLLRVEVTDEPDDLDDLRAGLDLGRDERKAAVGEFLAHRKIDLDLLGIVDRVGPGDVAVVVEVVVVVVIAEIELPGQQ